MQYKCKIEKNKNQVNIVELPWLYAHTRMLRTPLALSSTLDIHMEGTCLSIMASTIPMLTFFHMRLFALRQHTIGPQPFRPSMKPWWKYNLSKDLGKLMP